jgi:hypothetical protein
MLKYLELKEKPREFLSVTSLTAEEFQVLLPTFERCYQLLSPPKPKPTKKHKQRASGGGRKAKLSDMSDKLLFILAYQKTAPLSNPSRLTFWIESRTRQLLGASAVACVANEFGRVRNET